MSNSYMVNKSQNAPRMTQSIRCKRKDQQDKGELDENEIKKRMEIFVVEPTVVLHRGRTSREAKRGRKRGSSRSC